MGYGRLHRCRLRSQGRAGEGQPLEHHRQHIHLHVGALQIGDIHYAPVLRRDLDIAIDIVATDHIQNHVRAVAIGRL